MIVQQTKSGNGVFRFEGRDHPVPPASAFIAIVPEDAEYRFEAGATKPWRFGWINFYGVVSIQLWRAVRAAFGPVVPLPVESEAGRRFEQLVSDTCARRFADRYEASTAGFAFIMTLCRQLNAPSPTLAGRRDALAAVRWLTASRNLNTSVGVKSLASEAGVTREHFSRVFKAQHGESPGKFLRLQRLRSAREMMRATGLPLKEIALRCGFTSARHLTGALRAEHGRPTQRPFPSGGPES